MSSRDNDTSYIAESLPAFISEAEEHIEMLEQLLLQLESQPGDRELLDALFRSAHTMKGSAGIFGLERIVAFTHHMETLLDRLRAGKKTLTPEISTLLLRCNDQIRALVKSVQDGSANPADGESVRAGLVDQLRAAYGDAVPLATPATGAAGPAAAASAAPAASTHGYDVSVAFGIDTFRNGMDPLAILNYVRGLGTITMLECKVADVPALDEADVESCHLAFAFRVESTATRAEIEDAFSFVRDDCTLRITEAPLPGAVTAAATAAAHADGATGASPASPTGMSSPPAASEPRKGAASRDGAPRGTGEDSRFIRVQADRLDKVINLLGELVVASAGASLLARQTRHGSLIEANQLITSLVEEIRNGTLQLRMVPIGDTLARFRRVVRDTAAELGKDIALEIVGGEAELDKSVVERIADPLMHLVRNALDHGLETPEQRLAAGKAPQGHLKLSARHESGSILILIEDDGRGIDREKVLARAWERGLVERGVVPPDTDILNLIFEPGFSTAEKVTNLSGRGVGMDVVRRNIEALRGSVTVHSVPRQGSRIEIRLPLTLAIIDGFLVSVGSSKFILPLDAVVEVIESHPTHAPADAAGRHVVELRGQVLPVVSLRALYALDSAPPERSSVVVLQSGERRYGVMVDGLLGQHQTVIKPLGQMFRCLRGMAGSSILGNGEVALIFDVASLCQLAEQVPAGPRPASQITPTQPSTPQIATQG